MDREATCVKYIDEKFSGVRHSGTTFSEHLIGTYKILKSLGMPSDVCLAGLFHAVYSTEFFRHPLNMERDVVRQYIGAYAEDLAHTFCTMQNRLHVLLLNTEKYDATKHRHLLYIEYANLLEQLPRFNLQGKEEIENMIKQLETEDLMNRDDIHTCHAECQRPTCVAVREAVAAEREACAMECIKLAHKWTRLGAWGENNEFHDCAAAIRARGQA